MVGKKTMKPAGRKTMKPQWNAPDWADVTKAWNKQAKKDATERHKEIRKEAKAADGFFDRLLREGAILDKLNP